MTIRLSTTMLLLSIALYPAAGQSLQELSVEQLMAKFEANPKLDWVFIDSKPKHHCEAVLNELITRGPAGLTALLALQESRQPLSPDESEWSLRNDLAMLTAIRHLQGLTPPLKIRLFQEGQIRGTIREIPPLDVEIANVDSEHRAVWFTFGGDYRSGRLSRWRIHVWDDDGHQLPVIPRSFGMGGGVYSRANLEFGESDRRVLDFASFVRIREPGTYTAKLMYHDSISIADIEDAADLDELILVESDRFTLEIAEGPPIEIGISRSDYERSNKLISELNVHESIKMIGSEYGPDYHEFISPSSAHGQLLSMGKRAVPALLRRLKAQDATYRERAWILATLDSIMHERYLCPRSFVGAIDSYRCQFPGGNCSMHGSRSQDAQDDVVREWIAFAERYIRVREIKQDHKN